MIFGGLAAAVLTFLALALSCGKSLQWRVVTER
jgi:hypothetical protein